MMNTFRILFVDDDNEVLQGLKDLFEIGEYQNKSFGQVKIQASCCNSFNAAIECCKHETFELIVLDLMDGNTATDTKGLDVLMEIKRQFFTPIIFYSGFADVNQDLTNFSNSQIIDVISKGETALLQQKIKDIIENPRSLAFLQKIISKHVRDELKNFFWNHVHEERDKISSYNRDDYSLNYMFMKKLSYSLSKTKIKALTFDSLLTDDKAHPMEFYIYPSGGGDFEPGEILQQKSSENYYVLLTPACDLVSDRYKVDNVIIAKATRLEETREYKNYIADKTKSSIKAKLENLIKNNTNKSFFIPKTYFMPSLIAYFDDILSVKISELDSNYNRIAKLDDPFTQSLITKFTNCYNRIGTADIDAASIVESI